MCQEQVDRLLCSGLWCRLLNFTDPSTKTFRLMWTRQQCGIFISAAYHLWTSRPSCAAGGPPLSPRPSNGSDFYYLSWWDVHKEMVCQQDGKCISLPVLVWLFKREAHRVIELEGAFSVHWGVIVWHHLAGGNWRGMCSVTGSLMEVYYISFLQRIHMNICACHFYWPTWGPQFHYRKLSGCLWWHQ